MSKRSRSRKPGRVRKRGASPRSLRTRLEEAEQTLQAIRSGEVDAIVVDGPHGDRVFTLKGADHDYRVLMDEMSEGVATLTEGGLISYCNQRFASMIGLPSERAGGMPIKRIVKREARDRAAALLQRGFCRGRRG